MMKTREYVKQQLKSDDFKPLKGPLLVITHYKIPSPLSLPERKRSKQNLLPHIKKPDGDNLEKFLNDALNGVVWEDDSRIAWLLRSKSITNSKEGETVIFIRELESGAPDYEVIISDLIQHINPDIKDFKGY